jgi:hypothetical protein
MDGIGANVCRELCVFFICNAFFAVLIINKFSFLINKKTFLEVLFFLLFFNFFHESIDVERVFDARCCICVSCRNKEKV